MASWYRKFIPHFAEIIEPLNRLSKKNKKWEWRTEQIEAFEKKRSLEFDTQILPPGKSHGTLQPNHQGNNQGIYTKRPHSMGRKY